MSVQEYSIGGNIMQLIDIKSIKKKVRLSSQTEQFNFVANHRCVVIAKVYQFNDSNIIGYILRPVDSKNIARFIEKDNLEFMMFKNRSLQTADVVNVDVVRKTNGTQFLRVRDMSEIKANYDAMQSAFGGQMNNI